MHPDLQTLLSTPWTHERARLIEIIAIASGLDAHDRMAIAEPIAQARPDTAPALWLAEQLLDRHVDLAGLASTVTDLSWVEQLALDLVDAETIGVVSLGETTRTCLAALASMRAEAPVVRAPSSVIVRGIDDLGVIAEIGEPGSCDRCLVPMAATAPGRAWTSAPAAAVMDARPEIVVLLDDPIRRLGPWAQDRWAPPAWLHAMKTPG